MSNKADASDDEELVIMCGPVDALDHLSPKTRARWERLDGPYEQTACQSCGEPCMVGRASRLLIASGRATRWICVACVRGAVDRMASDDDGPVH